MSTETGILGAALVGGVSALVARRHRALWSLAGAAAGFAVGRALGAPDPSLVVTLAPGMARFALPAGAVRFVLPAGAREWALAMVSFPAIADWRTLALPAGTGPLEYAGPLATGTSLEFAWHDAAGVTQMAMVVFT